MPRLRQPPSINERQKALWAALNEFVTKHGGWIVSPRDASPIRFECRAASELPSDLRRLGYDVRSLGSSDRSLPIIETVTQAGSVTSMTMQNVAPATVEIFQFKLPFD
jgi:hypothetical protein